MDIQVRVIILSDRLQVLCSYVSFQIETRFIRTKRFLHDEKLTDALGA